MDKGDKAEYEHDGNSELEEVSRSSAGLWQALPHQACMMSRIHADWLRARPRL